MTTSTDFQNMSRTEQRVQLCKDVIRMVNSGKITSYEPCYVLFEQLPWSHKSIYDLDLQDAVLARGQVCEVCAIGGLVVALAHYQRCISADVDKESIHAALSPYFSELELITIEDVFEDDSEISGWFAAADAGSRIERLVMLMQNIIAGNGTFDIKRQPK